MGDFDKYTDYNPNAGITAVKIGFKKPVLETEFNEMQEISRQRLAKLVSDQIGEGIYGLGTMNYSGGVFTISNEKAIVAGELIDITSLSLSSLVNGNKVYLDVFDKEVSYLDTLKNKGNQQETSFQTNYLVDPRVLVETNRRVVLAYTLSKTNATSGHRYLLLGTITSGAFVRSVPILTGAKSTAITLGSSQPNTGWWFKEI